MNFKNKKMIRTVGTAVVTILITFLCLCTNVSFTACTAGANKSDGFTYATETLTTTVATMTTFYAQETSVSNLNVIVDTTTTTTTEAVTSATKPTSQTTIETVTSSTKPTTIVTSSTKPATTVTSSIKLTSQTTTSQTTTTTTKRNTTVSSTTVPIMETTTTTKTSVETYVVYKPSTHYIHKNTCHWVNAECYRIESTAGLEARKCTECNPEMEIETPYVEPVPETPDNSTPSSGYGDLTDWDIILLRRIVSSEYGADWVPVEEKAKIVASVMCQVNDPRYPDTILDCLNATCTPWGFDPYKDYYMSDSIIAAVDYYFANKDTVFASWTANSWSGDGTWNHFYYQ